MVYITKHPVSVDPFYFYIITRFLSSHNLYLPAAVLHFLRLKSPHLISSSAGYIFPEI